MSSTADLNNLKWIPKFAVANKQDKSVLLYDYEPSNDIIASNFEQFSSKNTSNTQSGVLLNINETAQASNNNNNNNQTVSLNYRLDNSIKYEPFLSHWRNKASKFDIDKNIDDNYFDYSCNLTNINNLINTYTTNHHLSNKDIGKIRLAWAFISISTHSNAGHFFLRSVG